MSTSTVHTATSTRTRAVDVTCRVLDVVVASIALVLLAPVLLIIAVIVRVESHGPAFFNQRRASSKRSKERIASSDWLALMVSTQGVPSGVTPTGVPR